MNPLSAGQLHVVHRSARSAPGAFSRATWELLTDSPVLLTSAIDAEVLAAQGIDVRLLSEPVTTADLVEHVRQALSGRRSVVLLHVVDACAPRRHDRLVEVLEEWSSGGGRARVHAVPTVVAGAHLIDLVQVMDRLRSPGGCPWDAQQTHETLLRYLVEETYEVLDAVHSEEAEHLREELGDLVLQVVFHARIAQESAVSAWSIDDVADGIVQKLVRRHPHVFNPQAGPDGEVSAQDVESRWKQLKADEKQRSGVLDGVPRSQPALLLAASLVSRAEAGAVIAAIGDVSADEQVLSSEAALGDHLLRLVVDASLRGLDAESALRKATTSAAEVIDGGGVVGEGL